MRTRREPATRQGTGRLRGLAGRAALGSALAGLAALGVVALGQAAEAASLFSDSFESGLASTWSKSGGTWAVVADGTQVLQESSSTSGLARLFNGSASWTDYTVQADVKPLAFGASSGVAGISARTAGATKFYRLVLTGSGQADLQVYNGSTSVTSLGTLSLAVTPGTWYTLRLDVSGTTVTGSVNGTLVGSGTSSLISSGRISVQTSQASAEFDNITVTSPDATPSPTSTATSTASTTATSTSTSTATSAPTTTTPSVTTTSAPATTTATQVPAASAIYVSPSGTDGAAGTIGAPTTLTSALTRVASGGTIYLRGGTYNLAQTVTIPAGTDGTASARTTLSAYPGETPVLDFSAQAEASANRGLQLNASYWHVYGITVQHAGDNGIFIGGSHNIVERVVTAFNHDSGLQISRIASDTPASQWPSDNLVVSSESHDNMDSGGENADGFAAKLTAGPGNVFRYDVSHNNIDDGWDLYTKTDTGPIGTVTIEYSLAYSNGTLTDGTQNAAGDRNGFKLGGEDIPVNHVIRHNLAYGNGHHGFTYNSNPGSMTISDDVSIDNATRNYSFDEGTSVFRNDTSCRFSVSGSNDKTVGDTDSSDQFWTGTNGSRCAAYSGALGWSFAADGHLVVTFGGTAVSL